MQKGLITILTPCYNTGPIVHRLLDSILMQDYPKVEMIAINDGSDDNTEQVIKSYISKFEAKGYSLTYIYQTNQGQSAAINNGLKLVQGEYLIWPDSDDFFRVHNALTTFVNALKNKGNNFGVVRCLPVHVDENTLEEEAERQLIPAYREENQFENCLYSKKFFWGAGDYLIRTSALDHVNPSRKIYIEKNAGQNWQLLLPVLYSYKCHTLEESVYCVLVRSNSHCRGQFKTYEEQVKKIESYKNTIIQTLNSMVSMPQEEKEYYKRSITNKYKLEQYKLAIKVGTETDKLVVAKELKILGIYPSLISRLLWKYENNRIVHLILRIKNRILG